MSMIIETFSFEPAHGWSLDPLPDLDSERTLVLCFGAPEFFEQPEPIRQLGQTYPRSQVVGCSTSGEILETKIADHSLSVAVVRFADTRLRCAVAPVRSGEGSYAAGESLAAQLRAPDLRGVFVLSDGLSVNGSDLSRGLSSVLPSSVAVTGGLAGDGERFARTWVLQDGAPRSGVVSALGLYGERVALGHGSDGGWDIFGPERVVTRSRGNVLYELDGKPALELYKQYLGELARGLPAAGLLVPLSLCADSQHETGVVRTILAVDEATQSLTFAGDVPTGHRAKLMRANFDRLIDGAAHAAQMTASTTRAHPPTPTLAIAISCVGRRLVLGERTEEEVEATLAVLPKGTRQIGFYSYGEMSPSLAGPCSLHNQTMTLTTISEA